MIIDHGACKRVRQEKATKAQWIIAGISGALVVLICGGLFPDTAIAQQRVVIEKATGNVVDVGDKTLQYDTRYFDHMDVPVSPIAAGQDVRNYVRDASGAIVPKPNAAFTTGSPDERRKDLIARISNTAVSQELKDLLVGIVKGMSR